MANITRIKAKDSSPEPKDSPASDQPAKSEKPSDSHKPSVTPETTQLKKLKKSKKTKEHKERKPLPKPLRIILKPFQLLAKPFVALGAYIKHSWQELRQVRWPNRKTAWKMTFAVIFYTAIFIVFIMLLDALFTALFNTILE